MAHECRQYQTSLNGISNLRLVTTVIQPPNSKQVLVKIHTVSLNYKDGESIEGLFKHHRSAVAPADLVPCADSAGSVYAVGEQVTNWREGDRVLSTSYPTFLTGQVRAHHLSTGLGSGIDGVLTEYRLFDEDAVVRTPEYLTDAEACNMQVAGTTAWMAMNGMRPLGQPGGKGETILLQGTGGVSMMGLLIAKAAGARVIITSSSDEKLARARGLGADETINYKERPDWDEEVLRLTDGRGVDIILENGGAQTTAQSFNCIGWGGLINSIGYVSGKIDPPEERRNINVSAIMKNFTLKGLLNGPRDRFEEMLAFAEHHQIHPVVDQVFPFEQAKEAFWYVWSGGHFGKVVISLSSC